MAAHMESPPVLSNTRVLQMAIGKHRQILKAPKPWARSTADMFTLASAEHRMRPTTCSTQNLRYRRAIQQWPRKEMANRTWNTNEHNVSH